MLLQDVNFKVKIQEQILYWRGRVRWDLKVKIQEQILYWKEGSQERSHNLAFARPLEDAKKEVVTMKNGFAISKIFLK